MVDGCYIPGVELVGIEPTTSYMPCKRSSQLSYSPRILPESSTACCYAKDSEEFLEAYLPRLPSGISPNRLGGRMTSLHSYVGILESESIPIPNLIEIVETTICHSSKMAASKPTTEGDSEMVPEEGLEPSTFCESCRRSTSELLGLNCSGFRRHFASAKSTSRSSPRKSTSSFRILALHSSLQQRTYSPSKLRMSYSLRLPQPGAMHMKL
jgi:hypothetical protein